jgi:hypothetical protein
MAHCLEDNLQQQRGEFDPPFGEAVCMAPSVLRVGLALDDPMRFG